MEKKENLGNYFLKDKRGVGHGFNISVIVFEWDLFTILRLQLTMVMRWLRWQWLWSWNEWINVYYWTIANIICVQYNTNEHGPELVEIYSNEVHWSWK